MLGPLVGLVFLIYPVRAGLASEPTPARIALALGGAALFASVFLWLMWTHEPLRSPSANSSEVRKHRATVAFLALLAVSLNLVLGSEWRVLFFHADELAYTGNQKVQVEPLRAAALRRLRDERAEIHGFRYEPV